MNLCQGSLLRAHFLWSVDWIRPDKSYFWYKSRMILYLWIKFSTHNLKAVVDHFIYTSCISTCIFRQNCFTWKGCDWRLNTLAVVMQLNKSDTFSRYLSAKHFEFISCFGKMDPNLFLKTHLSDSRFKYIACFNRMRRIQFLKIYLISWAISWAKFKCTACFSRMDPTLF